MPDALTNLDTAREFLTRHFGEISLQENEEGHSCAVPGAYLLMLADPSDRSLRKIKPLAAEGKTEQAAIMTLVNTAIQAPYQQQLVIRYAPKESDLHHPDSDNELYEVIGPEHPAHNHADGNILNFNVMAFERDGRLTYGDPSDVFNEKFHAHTHLRPLILEN